jgi:hypothetical protein
MEKILGAVASGGAGVMESVEKILWTVQVLQWMFYGMMVSQGAMVIAIYILWRKTQEMETQQVIDEVRKLVKNVE